MEVGEIPMPAFYREQAVSCISGSLKVNMTGPTRLVDHQSGQNVKGAKAEINSGFTFL